MLPYLADVEDISREFLSFNIYYSFWYSYRAGQITYIMQIHIDIIFNADLITINII